MADLDDVQGYGRKFENQLEHLETADIPQGDREAILEFIRHEDGNDTVNKGTMINHMNRLRLSSERASEPLMAMNKGGVDEFMFDLKHDYELAEGTLRNYRKVLRQFFRFHGRDWAEDIEVGAIPDREVDPSKLLSMSEITDLLDAASNPRDKALVALLADSGLRIGAATSLRVGDVTFEGDAGTVRINEEANVKGASGPKPITWSRGYIANYLDVHPRPEEDDVALFHKTREVTGDGALEYQYAARRVKDVAEEAGIDRDRVRTKVFRKSAISRWIRQGLSEQAIKHRAGWVKDSTQFQHYSGITDEEMNEDILEHYGLGSSEDDSSPTLEACPTCRTPWNEGVRFCPGCGLAVTAAAAEEREAAEDAVADDMVERETAAERREAREMLDELDDEIIDEVAGEVLARLNAGHDGSSQGRSS